MKQQIILVGIISLLSWGIYKYYQNSEVHFENAMHYRYADEYFIGEDRMHRLKPILWVHTASEVNAREWESFYSRNSTKLNQPFLYLTMKSILDKCKGSFNVCLIDDDAFGRLIPNWKVKMDALPSPIKEHYRQFALTTILYHYGGLLVPASTLCLDNLVDLFKEGVEQRDAFVVDIGGEPRFMGCKKQSDHVKHLMEFQGKLLKTDNTEQADFTGAVAKACAHMTVVDGGRVGTKKVDGSTLDLGELLGNNPLELRPDAAAIYIPAEEILRRPKYAWFSRLNQEQLLKSDLTLAKYFVN
jgi:hypothetical protein